MATDKPDRKPTKLSFPKPTKLSFPNDKRDYYVPSDFYGKQTLQELKNEYTRLRDIANKRIKRLEEANILFPEDLARFKTMFPKISEMKNPSEDIEFALSNVSKLLNKEASTLPTARELTKKRIKQMDDIINDMPRGVTETDLAQKLFDYKVNKNFAGLYSIYRATWAFIDYTKNILGENYFYWTETEMKKFWSNKEIIEKIANFDFDGAMEIFKQQENEEEGDYDEWEDFTL